jgi:hypothetical protein
MNNNNNNNGLNFMKLFMTMQDIATDKDTTIKDRVKQKERIVFATAGIIKPSNWETLSDNEKLKRLNKVQQQ